MGFLFRLFFGGWIIRLFPWWLWLWMAWFFGSMGWGWYQDQRVVMAEFETALRSGPPSAIDISAFDTHGRGHPLDEVQVFGTWRKDLGIGEIEQKYLNDRYVIVASRFAPNKVIAVQAAGHEINDVLRDLQRQNGENPNLVTINGFYKSSSGRQDIRRDLFMQGETNLSLVAVIEPYYGDRRAALQDQIQSKQDIVWVALVFAGVSLFMAIFKFVAWRRRARAKRMAAAPSLVQANADKPQGNQPFKPVPYPPVDAKRPVRASSVPKVNQMRPKREAPVDDDAARAARQQAKVDRIILEKFGKISRKRN